MRLLSVSREQSSTLLHKVKLGWAGTASDTQLHFRIHNAESWSLTDSESWGRRWNCIVLRVLARKRFQVLDPPESKGIQGYRNGSRTRLEMSWGENQLPVLLIKLGHGGRVLASEHHARSTLNVLYPEMLKQSLRIPCSRVSSGDSL